MTARFYINDGNNGTINDSIPVDNQITGVHDARACGNVPSTFALDQNYPNPFNPATTIRYNLPEVSTVSLKVYNLLGQLVATLVDGAEQIGYRSVEWNAGDMPSGIYICRLQAHPPGRKVGSFIEGKTMLLVR